jgi:hypothetical protein
MELTAYRAKVMQRVLTKVLKLESLPDDLATQLDKLIRTVDLSQDNKEVQTQAEQTFNTVIADHLQSQAECQSKLNIISHVHDLERRLESLSSETFSKTVSAIEKGVSLDEASNDKPIALNLLFYELPRYNQYLNSFGLEVADLKEVQDYFTQQLSQFQESLTVEGSFLGSIKAPFLNGIQITDASKFSKFLDDLKTSKTFLSEQVKKELISVLNHTVEFGVFQPYDLSLSVEGRLPDTFQYSSLMDDYRKVLDSYQELGMDLSKFDWAYPLATAIEKGYDVEFSCARNAELLTSSPQSGISLKYKQKSFETIWDLDNPNAKEFLKEIVANELKKLEPKIQGLQPRDRADENNPMNLYKSFLETLVEN